MTAGGPDNPYEPGTSDVPDSPAVREYHPLRFFYMAAVGVSLLTAGYLYLWNFDSRSEGQLILLSFSWLSILAGGGVGWVTLSHGSPRRPAPGRQPPTTSRSPRRRSRSDPSRNVHR